MPIGVGVLGWLAYSEGLTAITPSDKWRKE